MGPRLHANLAYWIKVEIRGSAHFFKQRGDFPRLVRVNVREQLFLLFFIRAIVVEPFEPPQASEFSDTKARVADTKRPAIFQTTTEPVIFVYLKWPVRSIGILKTEVGGRPVPQR